VNSEAEETIFAAALELRPEERAVYLQEVCRGDAARRRRVAALVRAHEQAGEFMAEPAALALSREMTRDSGAPASLPASGGRKPAGRDAGAPRTKA